MSPAEALSATRASLASSPALRDAVTAYLGAASDEPGINPAAVTSDMLVLDVRPSIEFVAGHFPGAVSIPQDALRARVRELPTDRRIVVYCWGEFCRMARESARWLRERGLDARAMDEVVVEWRVAKDVDLDVA